MAETEQRLWTPWRMGYITGQAKEDGCIFCNRLRAGNDVDALILQRWTNAFVIMNLFPYNTGHVMIVPNEHVSDLKDLTADATIDVALLAPRVTSALRRVFDCAGFNLGLNIGDVAGAGIAAHLHQHVVPRWVGDANFMPILASTMVIPELIPTTYAKVRAELQRELVQDDSCRVVVLTNGDRSVALRHGDLPQTTAGADEPVWKAALRTLPSTITQAQIAGWAGAQRADGSAGPAALTVRSIVAPDGPEWSMVDCDVALREVDESARTILRQARANIAPRIAPQDAFLGKGSPS